MKRSTNKWLVCYQPKQAVTQHLICFPFGGGAASVYRDWARLLPESTQLWSVQLPGREDRFTDAYAADYQTVISGVMEAIESLGLEAITVFGHSMGAHFSILVAQSLAEAGLLKSVVVSGIKPPCLEKQRLWGDASEQALKEHVISLGAIPNDVQQDQAFLGMYLEKIRADYQLYEGIPVARLQPIDQPIVAIQGDSDPLFTNDEFKTWEDYSTQNVEFVTFAGGHFYFQPYHKPLLRVISQHLRGL